MSFSPLDLSQQVVGDKMYMVQHAQVRPSFEVLFLERATGLEAFYGSSSFTTGKHYCIIHSHCSITLKNISLNDVLEFIEKLEWDIQYYEFVLNKLTFDVHQEAIQILTKHIAKDKALLEEVKDKKREIKLGKVNYDI